MRKCWAVWAAALCLVCAGCLFAPSEPTVADGSYTTAEAMSGSACEAAVAAFLAALDSGDAAAARALFSPEALAADGAIDETLAAILDCYAGPLELQETFGSDTGDTKIDHGMFRVTDHVTRFLRAGGASYWCDFVMTSADDWNPDAVGFTRVRFYTIDAFCSLQAGLWKPDADDSLGLFFYDGPAVEGEIRIVDKKPLPWTETATLDPAAVTAFLEAGHVAYDDFVAAFGPPAATWQGWKAYYALPPVDGEPRYLSLSVNEATHDIYVAGESSELEDLESLWVVSGDDR